MGQRALVAVSSLRARAGTLAAAQFRGAAGELLADALDKLEGRLRRPASALRSSERMREVLERDRALAFAGHAAAMAIPPASSSAQSITGPAPVATREDSTPRAPRDVVCHEPIRTRTFARLLAAQGHLERALSIYDYLIHQHPGDAVLRDEVATLRGP
jgi:hypothetical protein